MSSLENKEIEILEFLEDTDLMCRCRDHLYHETVIKTLLGNYPQHEITIKANELHKKYYRMDKAFRTEMRKIQKRLDAKYHAK